jgi:hypothetical protein
MAARALSIARTTAISARNIAQLIDVDINSIRILAGKYRISTAGITIAVIRTVIIVYDTIF